MVAAQLHGKATIFLHGNESCVYTIAYTTPSLRNLDVSLSILFSVVGGTRACKLVKSTALSSDRLFSIPIVTAKCRDAV